MALESLSLREMVTSFATVSQRCRYRRRRAHSLVGSVMDAHHSPDKHKHSYNNNHSTHTHLSYP